MFYNRSSTKNVKAIISSRNLIFRWSIINLNSILFLLIVKLVNGSPTSKTLSNSDISELDKLKLLSEYPSYGVFLESDNDSENNNIVKRSWQSLQGSWGKRAADGYDSNLEHFDESSNLLGESKEFDDTKSDNEYDNMIRFPEVYNFAPNDDGSNEQRHSKRAWKNMNSAWGKRRSANEWNKFRGSWGKREPAWNNLKGLWGKRSENWGKLQSAWGK